MTSGYPFGIFQLSYKVSTNQKKELPMVAMIFVGLNRNEQFIVEELAYIYLILWFQRRRFVKFQPNRNQNWTWQACFCWTKMQ
jgi:hypothetical protein